MLQDSGTKYNTTQMGTQGNLLMDVPPHSCVSDLTLTSKKDRTTWRDVVSNINKYVFRNLEMD